MLIYVKSKLIIQ